jgi:3-dehydroquinate dehydratase type I
VFESDTKTAITAMEEAAQQADIIELRLDAMHQPDIDALMAARPTSRPIIVTARRPDEGGAFSWTDEKKIDMLARAAELGADYIDIELQTAEPMRRQLIDRKGAAKIIVSWHNYMFTPDRTTLRRQLRRSFEAGADVAKIVTFARESADVGRMLEVVADHSRRGKQVIGFCMGEAGKLSRLATLWMGGFLTFAYLHRSTAVAPGMPSVEELLGYLNDFHFWPPGCTSCQPATPMLKM